MAVLLAAPFLAVMDGFIAIVAGPSIETQLHTSDAGVQLVVAARVVAYAGLLVMGGRLGDIYGRRELLVAGLLLFSATSLFAATAPSEVVLIFARALQGGSAALMYPQTLALIQGHFQGRDLAKATAALGVALGMASVVAQLVGGLIVQADVLGLGWRAVFLVHLPIGVAAAASAVILVPRSTTDHAARLDVAGAVLLTTGLFALVLPLTVGRQMGWPAWTWVLLAGAAAVGGMFVLHERRASRQSLAPLLSLDLFRVRSIAVGLLATLALYGGQLSLWLLLTLYLQNGLGLSPLATGVVFTPVALGVLAGSVGAPSLPAWLRHRVLTIGALGLAAGVGALSLTAAVEGDRPNVVDLLPILLVIGGGFGLVIPSLVNTVLRVVPNGHEGAASGALVTTQQVAGALGVALTGVVLFGLLHHATPYPTAFALTLGLNVALFLIGALLVQALRDES